MAVSFSKYREKCCASGLLALEADGESGGWPALGPSCFGGIAHADAILLIELATGSCESKLQQIPKSKRSLFRGEEVEADHREYYIGDPCRRQRRERTPMT